MTALLLLALVLVMGPGVLALNRGHILRNAAIWLAIVLALALLYRNFGPGGRYSLLAPAAVTAPDETGAPSTGDKDDKDDGSKGFTPPPND
jgi:hypothetical protein